MIRISDARMSGTAFGTIVLHVAPEAAVGGPLALVKTGDRITLDVPKRILKLHVDAKELAARRKTWKAPAAPNAASAAIPGCSTGKCCRPTKASISASWVPPNRDRHGAPGPLGRRHLLRLPGLYRRRHPLGGAPELRDFECVIVDDASTDDSPRSCSEPSTSSPIRASR